MKWEKWNVRWHGKCKLGNVIHEMGNAIFEMGNVICGIRNLNCKIWNVKFKSEMWNLKKEGQIIVCLVINSSRASWWTNFMEVLVCISITVGFHSHLSPHTFCNLHQVVCQIVPLFQCCPTIGLSKQKE